MRAFQLIDEERAHHAVSLPASVLKVTPQGYYAWRKRLAEPGPRRREDARLYGPILALYARSRERMARPGSEAGCGSRRTSGSVPSGPHG